MSLRPLLGAAFQTASFGYRKARIPSSHCRILLAALLILSSFTSFSHAADQVVMNNANDGTGSLRQAIVDTSPGDTVTFDPSLNGATIQLSEDILIQQPITIDASALPDGITISGDVGGNGDPTDDVRIFSFTTAANYTLDSLTFYRGDRAISSSATSGTIRNCVFRENQNTAVFISGDALALDNCQFIDNIVKYETPAQAYNGGAIYNAGATILITNSVFVGNKARDGQGVGDSELNNDQAGRGGAIFNAQGTLTIDTCTLDDNSAGLGGGNGGAIAVAQGSLTIRNSTVSNNQAGPGGFASSVGEGGHGGGIFAGASASSVKITQSTISGNRAGDGGIETSQIGGSGGGVYMEGGSLTLENSTVFGNEAGDGKPTGFTLGGSGGGIFISNGASIANLENTIVAGNAFGIAFTSGNPNDGTGPDISATSFPLTRNGVNLIGSNEGVETFFPSPDNPGEANFFGDLVGTESDSLNPRLGPLQDNGGLTLTHLPLPGTPAFNPEEGDDDAPFATDQRGSTRVVGGILDIGAVEAPNYIEIAASNRIAARASLSRQIRKLSKKVKAAKRKKQISKAKRFAKKLRRLRIALRSV